ncbi:MAG: hypothetical protein ABL914_00935 [Novosphingobium sp.]|uniref:hypothetical protein n=1 Tax=Novosphingobium sp. TaxID=1874826 RepID=UPI0032BACFEE
MRLWPSALLLGAASLAWAVPSPSDQWPARDAGLDPAGWSAAFPNSSNLLRRNLGAQIEAGDDAGARQSLGRLAAMGYALSPAGQDQTARWLDPVIRNSFAANAAPKGQPSEAGSVPAEFGLVEAITYSGSLRIASGVTAQDLLISRDGRRWNRLSLAGLGSITGLVRDRKSGLVWAASGIFEQTPRSTGAFSGLILVDPRHGQVLRKIAAPAGVVPSDIALGPDGTVYASDPLNGGVWLARPGSKVLEPLVPPGRFKSPQGLVVSADGRMLYLSDYGYGLALIDLPGGQVRRLPGTPAMMLDGIDGLHRSGNRLIAIQNGTRPIRIAVLQLAPGGRSIASMRVILQAPSGGGEPTSGQIIGGRLVYVSNARWDLFGAGGEPAGSERPGPTVIASIKLVESR